MPTRAEIAAARNAVRHETGCEWEELNRIRGQLIDKKIFGGGLSGFEAVALEHYQAVAGRYVEAVAPRPTPAAHMPPPMPIAIPSLTLGQPLWTRDYRPGWSRVVVVEIDPEGEFIGVEDQGSHRWAGRERVAGWRDTEPDAVDARSPVA